MNDYRINELLDNLKNPDEEIRDRATAELWKIWFEQKGAIGFGIIRQAQLLLEAGEIKEAEITLTQLISDLPDFAEAWNRRAVLYYSIGEYKKAIADCKMVIKLNPIHFGALHGLGLCHAAIGEYREAIKAFHQALEIQPHALINQKLILECTARLS